MKKLSDNIYQVAYVDRFHFRLKNGDSYRHLFSWRFDPDLQDFENLLSFCHIIMIREDLQINDKA